MSESASSSAAAAAAGMIVQATNIAAVSARAYVASQPSPLPPLVERHVPAPRIAYLHDTKVLIAAIWPDAPPDVTLDQIAAKAKAHREIFEQYGERWACCSRKVSGPHREDCPNHEPGKVGPGYDDATDWPGKRI